MTKKKKKIITVAVIGLLALSAGAAGVVMLLKNSGNAVKVFSMNDVAMSDYWGDTSETEGIVDTRNMQSVYVSNTQQVTEIFVTEGQQVRRGDKIAAFDTTLSDLELERQRINVEKMQYNLKIAKSELAVINGYKPYVPPTPQPEPEPEELEPMELPFKSGGAGTEERPYIYLWNDDCWYTDSFVNSILPKIEITDGPTSEPDDPEDSKEAENTEDSSSETPEGSDSSTEPAESFETEEKKYQESRVWVVFEKRQYDNTEGEIITYWGMTFSRNQDGTYKFAVYEPQPDYAGKNEEPAEPEEPEAPEGPQYTAAEIAQMRAQKQKEITDLELQIKVEKVKYEKLKIEVNTGVVTAAVDGVVKTLADPEEARMNGTPFIVVSGGGGYYIQGNLSEMELDTVKIGQTVKVISWMNYAEIEAEIVEISRFPDTSGNNWTNGNSNVSYYPFTVFVNEDAALQDGEYVSIQYSPAASSSGIYLEIPFVLTENSKSYVFVKTEDGKLEKREITTGKVLWSSSVEIIDGLTMDDYIAFPYGKDVKDGAYAVEADISELYENMYY